MRQLKRKCRRNRLLLNAKIKSRSAKQCRAEIRPRKAGFTQSIVSVLGAAALIGMGTLAWADPTPERTPEQTTEESTLLPEVVVPGKQEKEESYKSEASSLPKYTEPLRDTPQSITVVPQDLMEEEGVTTLREALRNVAGISLAAGEGGSQGDNLTLRGFTARNDIFLDGMRDFGSYYRDPFNLQAVEVLKGPSSITFGRGSTGGVINQVSKMPGLTPHVEGTLGFGTDRTRRATADIQEPLQELGPGASLRLNLMVNDSHVADRDIAENRRFGFAPSLAFGLGTPTRLTFSYFYQSENDIPDYGIPWLFNQPAPVPRNNYYGFEKDNFLETAVDIGTARLEHDFNNAVTLRNQIRYGHYSRDARITEARIAGTPTPATPLSAINVTRNQIVAESVETFFQNQLDMIARFNTGFIDHALVAGIEVGRETSDPIRSTFAGVPVTSLLDPDENQPFAGTPTVTSRVDTTADSVGVYLIDTLKLGKQWELTGGLRWDRFDASYKQSVSPAAAFDRTDQMLSWRGALAYKPAPNGSVYFGYGTSFNPSAETLSLSAANANLEPEKNETYEVGSKWDLFSDSLALRAALFRTEKTNAREPDSNNPLLNVLAGKQRVDGIEVEAAGRLTDRWQIFTGYAYMKSELVRSVFFPSAVGSQLANVPKQTFNLWTTYALPWGVEIGGGGRYVGSRTASTTVPLDPITGLVKEAPGYWAFDAMAEYYLMELIEIQLNLYNLTDKYYYEQLHPAHIVPGPGRSALLTMRFEF
ncbi:MAG: TonB-dependent siderophore receptor [Candidatus Manganitrophaceae bacterium]|nr:MAG: TonB-dependent siderophore receptor [Candidatus Manganitrophaceae bacterium]